MNKEKREEIERYIKEHATEYLERDKSGKGYICPICGSGSGPHGTGITENPKSKGHFTCWAGCFQNADIFEIIGNQFNLTDFNEIFIKACELFNISLDESYTRPSAETRKSTLKERREDYSMTENKNQNNGTESANFTEFYKQAAANIEMTDYHRGLGLNTLKRFNVGYMPKWRASEIAPYSSWLIIPITEHSYSACNTKRDGGAKYIQIGKKELFNAVALEQDKEPVFITEGEIDALSIIDAGGQAVALGGVANIGKLIAAVKEGKVKARLIISLDNDEAGRNAAEKLEEQLKQAGFFSYRHFSVLEGYKDENELLTNNRKEFEEWVKAGKSLDFTASKEENQNEGYKPPLTGYEYVKSGLLEADLNKFQSFPEIYTGFENLDQKRGRLTPGVYAVGAMTSLGKTSFCLQIADNIARQGHCVLYFALEQNRLELTAKSISRLTAKRDLNLAMSALNIRGGNFYNEAQRELYEKAVEEYQTFSKNIAIVPLGIDATITTIISEVQNFIEYTGLKPVVFVDYLQIIQPDEKSKGIRENNENHMRMLKKLQSENEIVLFLISSFNRTNYTSPVDYESFKETGVIEYTVDTLWGLQPTKMVDKLFLEDDKKKRDKTKEIKKAMRADPREIMLVDLKDRGVQIGYSCGFIYYPKFDLFDLDKDFQDESTTKNDKRPVY